MQQARRLLWCALSCAGLLGCQTATETSDDQLAQENYSEIPLSQSEADDIRTQIERNWNLAAGDQECPIDEREPVELRVYLDTDGTVAKVEPFTDVSKDKCLFSTYDEARRAVMISSPLDLPPGKAYPVIRLRFSPAEAFE
jgi:hypothetical protein